MKKILFLITLMVSMFTMSSCEKDEQIIELVCDVVYTPVSTNGGCDGSITVTIKTGNNGYNYTISSINLITPISNTSGKFTELKSGNYSVMVTDSKGKTFSKDITITEPNQLTCTVTSTNVTTTNGNNGSITITVISGNGGYNYTINSTNLPTPISNTTGVFKDLKSGVYSVIVTDSKNQTFKNTVTIEPPYNLVLTVLDATDITLFSATLNAKVNVGNVQSTGYFQYGQNSQNFTNESTPINITTNVDYNPKLNLNNLTPNTTYYYRYVIINDKETIYSNIIQFTTPNIQIPTYNLLELSYTSTSVTFNGNVNSNDIVSTIVFYEYSTSDNFSTSNSTNSFYVDGSINKTISATINLTSLTLNTKYYYRMVVTKNGITYKSETKFFTTNIVIGNQMFGGTVFEVTGTYPNQHGKVIQNTDYKNTVCWSNVSVDDSNGKTWVLPTFDDLKNAYSVLSPTYKLTQSYWTNQINQSNSNMVLVFETTNQNTYNYYVKTSSSKMRLITTF